MTEDKTLRDDNFREDEPSLWAVPRRHRGEAIPIGLTFTPIWQETQVPPDTWSPRRKKGEIVARK